MVCIKTGNRKLETDMKSRSDQEADIKTSALTSFKTSLLQMSRHLEKHYQVSVLPKLMPTNTYKLPLWQILAKTLFEHIIRATT